MVLRNSLFSAAREEGPVPQSRKSDSVLVLGGGIAGLQSAIDLANLGIRVHLVERSPSIGGRMAQLDKTFPTNDCSMCILAPKMIECASHPLIDLLTYSELERFTGSPGRFKATIRKKSRFINDTKCTGCGECSAACPVEVPNEYEMNLAVRKAVYKPFPQAVPNVFTITKPGRAPCKDRCPAHLDVQAYVQLAKLGKFDEALGVIHESMPFAGTIGRICPRPCESACTRSEVDAPVAIAALKRAAADFGNHRPAVEVDGDMQKRRSRRPVAVIGSGPAGLSAAYHLARKGYPVTVLEKLPVAGGMLRVGVPAYRLPRKILEDEIELVRALGVKIKTSSPVKSTHGIRSLFKDGFKAIFIATGAHGSMKLGVAGEHLRGVVPAVDFLRRVNLGRKVTVGRRVIVVGGGNAAVDAARTILRLGADEVTILYRRTRTEMPALSWEVDAAVAERIKIEFLTAPSRITGKRGRVEGLEALRMRLGEPDDSGRRRPVPIEGSAFIISCDMIVPAIGQFPLIDFLGPRSHIRTSRWGTVVSDTETCAAGMKGVFAGGDVATGPWNAIEAIAAGNRAAESIHRYLEGQSPETAGDKPGCIRPDEETLEDEPTAERVDMPELPVRKRLRSFSEVERGYSRKASSSEASRCINCAVCSECHECDRVCEAGAVDHQRQDELVTLEVGACVIATGFDLMDSDPLTEYGAGKIANVLTGLEFERLLSASGPTGGHVRRPSDGKPPKRIAFIQCVGSRDLRNHSYCSAVCCMHATKEAILAHEHDPDVRSTIFYMDLRAAGKTFQDYIARAREEYSVSYVRARPARVEVAGSNGDIKVIYEDTMINESVSATFDLVILCQALVPSGSGEIAEKLGVKLDEHGFIHNPDPLGAPVDTTVPGIFAAGYASGPQDIPDSVVQATAAAGRAAEVLRGEQVDQVEREKAGGILK
jgi:heterodisulfide reductase subunit A-like polyferredoxin